MFLWECLEMLAYFSAWFSGERSKCLLIFARSDGLGVYLSVFSSFYTVKDPRGILNSRSYRKSKVLIRVRSHGAGAATAAIFLQQPESVHTV